MADWDDDFTQLRFRDGSLVDGSSENEPSLTGERPEPGAESGYRVEAKPGALEVNRSLLEAVEEYGQPLEFSSRQAAERYAAQLSAGDGDLRLQSAAPNDPESGHAYFLAAYDPAISEPASVDGETWTFDVGANLYGTLGEAIIIEAPKPHAVEYFVAQDLGRTPEEASDLHVEITNAVPIFPDSDHRSNSGVAWVPDCKLIAREGLNGRELETYYCEIKTGSASFERGQRPAMKQLASHERVLSIRVGIEDLPASYTIRIDEVETSGSID